MNLKVIVPIGIVAIVLAALFVFTDISYFVLPHATKEQASLSATPQQVSIVIQHSVAGRVHMYSGNFPVPACQQLTSELSAVGGDPAHLTIRLNNIARPTTGCETAGAHLQHFSLSYTASGSAKPILEVLVNDIIATATLAEH